MSAENTYTIYPDEKSWLEARRKKVTSSDVPGLLGCYPSKAAAEYKNPYAMWLRKTSEEPEESDKGMRRRFEAGHTMEGLLHKWTEEDADVALYDLGDYATVSRGVLAATPDRVIVPDRIEVKSAKHPQPAEILNAALGLAEFKTDAVQNAGQWQEGMKYDYAVIQLNVALHCADLTEGLISACFGMGLDFSVYFVQKSPELVSIITERAEEFMECVLTGTPPSAKFLDDSEAVGKSLRQIYSQDSGETIELGEEWAEKIAELEQIRAAKKELEEREREIKNAAQLAMGEAAEAVIPGASKKFTWVTSERKGYVKEVKPSTVRTFRIANA